MNTDVASKESWAESGLHTVYCPSGAVVRIRFPDLSDLIARDAIPDHLRNAALLEVSGGRAMIEARIALEQMQAPDGDDPGAVRPTPRIDQQTVKEAYDLTRWLVTVTVAEPKVELDDLPGLPQEDLEMLIELASRSRDTDARGVRLGVRRLSDLERFRHEHQCPADCEACSTVLDAVPEVASA